MEDEVCVLLRPLVAGRDDEFAQLTLLIALFAPLPPGAPAPPRLPRPLPLPKPPLDDILSCKRWGRVNGGRFSARDDITGGTLLELEPKQNYIEWLALFYPIYKRGCDSTAGRTSRRVGRGWPNRRDPLTSSRHQHRLHESGKAPRLDRLAAAFLLPAEVPLCL
jgi:hypothetical protein